MSVEADPSPATEATRAANVRAAARLTPDFAAEAEWAHRGFIGTIADGVIRDAEGRIVWDVAQYGFLEGEAPDTVHPSLWRYARLNALHGLFRVVDGVHQVRAFDVSNVTLIEGRTGWIVVDPLTNAETARAALDLAHRHLPARPIHAVIYTHSHVDHFGGAGGIVSPADVRAGNVQVIAPEGFLEAAVSENVIAGNAMARRSGYQFGTFLPRGPRGQVDAGMGKTLPTGTVTLVPPTTLVTRTGQEMEIDGVRFVFQMAPETEAPAEMTFLLPERRALCMAELCTASMHNVYTLRGARVRDALSWSKYIDEAIALFGARADVVFAQHTWPRWGNAAVLDFLRVQRDVYRHIHDQAMRAANDGQTIVEVGEAVELPEGLASHFHARGYYGTVNHNAKAVYQHYLGWFDGNPAHLHALPPAEAARRYVEYMGGAAALLEKAGRSFQAGDYRWVAEVVNHVVFADPTNDAARDLQARALEQLGYQCESAIWRNFYLTGALELRRGVPPGSHINRASIRSVVSAMTAEMLFDALAVRLNAERAAGRRLTINVHFTDAATRHVLRLAHGTLGHAAGADPDPDATLAIARSALDELVSAPPEQAPQVLAASGLRIEGRRPEALLELFSLLDRPDMRFPVVTP
jgi:alkyl sulfatase BDS1-like metallo-beta-lactamase superfamily hydrolase